ncbi:MAG: outer membrane protein assembly factor BamB [Verrucomicrobiales bacterium]|jgi:outer membrane protein assembly factor BamB
MLLRILLLSAVLTSAAYPIENWADFRGPDGDGVLDEKVGLPLEWSEEKNVVWKTEVKGRAWSSPVVWGKQVWMTNATEDGKTMSVVCLDRETGKILFDRFLFENDTPEPLGNNVNGYGSPSPVIEEGRVFIHFGSYGTACLDTATGKTLWERRDLPCQHLRGPGSSPVLFKDLLILTMDGADVQYLVALDKKSGKNVWKTDRATKWTDFKADGSVVADGDRRKAYTTPTFVTVDGKVQMISPGATACFAYDPATGEELWFLTYAGYSNASRVIVEDGMAFINTGFGKPHLLGVRLDGKMSGDVTESHVEWDVFKRVPKRSSPVVLDRRIYMVNDEGILTCLNVDDGSEIWSDRLRGHFSASVLAADGRIYFFSEMGDAYAIAVGDEFELLATNHFESGFMASPAVAGKSFFLRTKTHVYRVEGK